MENKSSIQLNENKEPFSKSTDVPVISICLDINKLLALLLVMNHDVPDWRAILAHRPKKGCPYVTNYRMEVVSLQHSESAL